MLCTEELIQSVWGKGAITATNDPKYWRQDHCGAWISRSMYGCQRSPFGWEIGYIDSQLKKDGQKLFNLCPLQWKNNIHKQDGDSVCILKAEGVENCKIVPMANMVTANDKN